RIVVTDPWSPPFLRAVRRARSQATRKPTAVDRDLSAVVLRCRSCAAEWRSPGAQALIEATGKCLACHAGVDEVATSVAGQGRSGNGLDIAFELAGAAQ